jgi:hypothetical protein
MAYTPIEVTTTGETPDNLFQAFTKVNAEFHKIEQEFNSRLEVVTLTIDGGEAAISEGAHGWWSATFQGTIVAWELLADPDYPGDIELDIWKGDYDNWPPTEDGSICGENYPAIADGDKAYDDTLTDWTKGILIGDKLWFQVTSCTDIQRITLTMTFSR